MLLKQPRIRGLPLRLTTPEVIRTLQRKLYCKAKQDDCACLAAKDIGKPCAGKPHARFDEGGLGLSTMEKLLGHRQTKGPATDNASPTVGSTSPLLYQLNSLRRGKPPSKQPEFGKALAALSR
jgi:hypothetical protein